MELHLGSDLARLVRIWRALIDYRLSSLNITQTHWMILYNICKLPYEQSQIQLAKAIGVEQPSLVRTLDQLEEKGLIIRCTCPYDRRAKRIKLTKIALPFIKRINIIINETRKEILKNIINEEIKFLINIIIKLENNILNIFNEF